jgi:hypothetical protein
MKQNDSDELIGPGLAAEIRAAAADAHRPARDLVQEAVERYLAELHAHPRVTPDAQTRSETVRRMLARRRTRPLSDGVTIEQVIGWGREGRA